MELDPVSRILFPRPPASYNVDSFPGELIWVPRSLNPQTSSPEDCVPLCLLQCNGAKYLVVYIHSNFEDLGRCHSFCMSMRYHLKAHVLAVEYPGYGIAPGTTCEEQRATEAAHVAVRFAHEVLRWPWDSIILMGRSIGTGPATTLAAMYRFGGLVLVAPFLSVRDLCREYIGAAAGFIRERFPNSELITQVKCPCLIVHGRKDTMVPVRHGNALHDLCTSRKCFVSPVDMEHNTDLLEDEEYLISPMRAFFDFTGDGGMEIQVPSWAFDKQLSPDFVPVAQHQPQGRISCSWLPGSCACESACRPCGCNPSAGGKVVHVEPVRSSCSGHIRTADLWVVEEPDKVAVEYSGVESSESQAESLYQTGSEKPRHADRLARDPALGSRMAQVLRRAQEVATEALASDNAPRPSRASGSSSPRASRSWSKRQGKGLRESPPTDIFARVNLIRV